MSKRGDPVRVVEQLDLDGGISVIEPHGLGGRTRTNVLRCKTARAVADAIRASVDLNESKGEAPVPSLWRGRRR